ncbi:MAG: exodeoxyribonuclease VII small subunit [Ruminococcaceae bacterium]|nr:exodeoxyribonuclease VII small subunit [Oscillospiraceae bacterium]
MAEKKEMSFEESVARLEQIVKDLENGKAPLSDSLALFEEGVALVRACTEELDKAEKRIIELTGGEADE